MAGVRSRNIYDPASDKPFKLSRSRLELFLNCPRCFYVDRRLGVDRVGMPAFTLNTATDTLLKKEFDLHRKAQTPHRLMAENKIDAVPFQHEKIDEWRENFKGVQYLHEPTNLLITGAVDDVWVQPDGTLIVVDYKSTSINGDPSLEGKWKEAYKRQMEIYQWLLRRNDFTVSDTGYFVYVNADTSKEDWSGHLVFDEHLLPYTGDDSWVEQAVVDAHKCLMSSDTPQENTECEWCAYVNGVNSTTT
jgi:RecB family exonuclease